VAEGQSAGWAVIMISRIGVCRDDAGAIKLIETSVLSSTTEMTVYAGEGRSNSI